MEGKYEKSFEVLMGSTGLFMSGTGDGRRGAADTSDGAVLYDNGVLLCKKL